LHFAFCISSAGAQTRPTAGYLVVPFESSTREPRLYWLAEASAVLLTDDLSALGASVFSRDDRLQAFEQLRVPPVATLSEATLIRVGRVVGAAQVVVGSYSVTGDTIAVRMRAVRLDSGRISAEVVEGGPLVELFAVFARVARRLAPESAVSIEDMERGHPPLAAFEQFVKGVLAENPATQAAFLREALRLAPDFHRSRIALWNVLTDQGEHQQAFDLVRVVPSGDPQSRTARFLASVSLIHLARNAEAVIALTDLQRDKPDAAILNNIGVAQLRRAAGSTVAATPVSFFRLAIGLNPEDADLAFNLGYASWLARDVPGAIMSLREAVRRNTADDAAHYVLGVALQAAGSQSEGQREKDLAKRLSSTYAEWDARPTNTPQIPPALERIALTLDAGRSARVEEALAAAGQRDQREQAAFHLNAGRRLVEAGRNAEAIAELRRTIYLTPYDREAHLLLGRAYLRTGGVQEAIDELKISIWSDDRVDAHLVLADAYVQAREEDAARAELQIVLARDPSNAEARRAIDRLPSP
jgi:tetratricopeptide (TPR) repeat protein